MYRPTSKQRSLFTASSQLDEKRQRLLGGSWAEGFRAEVFPVLLEREDDFSALYATVGRPPWSVARMLGLLVLRELRGLRSDQEAVESLAFDTRWQHALDIGADKEAYLSRRSLVDFRSRLARHDPEGTKLRRLFSAVSAAAIRRLGLSSDEQRTDSTFVLSNMQRRNRDALLREVLRLAIKAIEQAGRLDELPEHLQRWYATLDGWSESSAQDIEAMGQRMRMLLELYAGDEDVADSDAFRTMRVVVGEHVEESEHEPPPPSAPGGASRRGGSSRGRSSKRRRRPKSGSTKRSRRHRRQATQTVQSPHDLDARKGRKGVGYNAHLTETCGNGRGVEILTDVDVVPANRADKTHLPVVLERLRAQGALPSALLADGGYSSLQTSALAEAHGVALISPVHRGNLAAGHPKWSRTAFGEDEQGRVTSCPEGHAPIEHRTLQDPALRRVAIHALFDGATCERCPSRPRCPTQSYNHGTQRKLSLDQQLRDRDTRHEQQRESTWRRAYGLRAGIEATGSELKRAHGMARFCVRGLLKMLQRALLKGIACNAKRWVRALAHSPTTPAPVSA